MIEKIAATSYSVFKSARWLLRYLTCMPREGADRYIVRLLNSRHPRRDLALVK